MQRLHLKWFTAHGPVAMAALLGVIALVSLFLGLANQRALDWISHTSQVQRSLSSLSTSLIDALQAERLYILTGDDDSLANRLRAQTAVLDHSSSHFDRSSICSPSCGWIPGRGGGWTDGSAVADLGRRLAAA